MLTERTQREGESEAMVRTVWTAVPQRRTARRGEMGPVKQIKNTPDSEVLPVMPLLMRDSARVGKEAAKVSEMGGCARQR